MPLFLVAHHISEDVFNELIENAILITTEKQSDDAVVNEDTGVLMFLGGYTEDTWQGIGEMTNFYNTDKGEEKTSKWFGRALKRLNVVRDKKRKGSGIEVKLDRLKIQDKLRQAGVSIMEVTKEKTI